MHPHGFGLANVIGERFVKGEAWLWLIGGLLFVSLLLREGQLFVVAVILLLVSGVSQLWERYCLHGLGYRRVLGQTRAFFGEEVPLTVEIVNEKPLPLAWLEVDHRQHRIRGEAHGARPGTDAAAGARRPVSHSGPTAAEHAALGALV